MMNETKRKIERGAKALGTFLGLSSSAAVECLGAAGLDYVIIDTEHGPVGIEGEVGYIRAAELAGLTPFVRIHEICRSAVLHALDAGAQGLIVPCVETLEQVKKLVEWAKFSPLGARGFCPTRDALWNHAPFAARGMEEYMVTCNRETLLIPQCETMGCLEHIEEIAAADGVDGIFLGPYDLSIAMGKPGKFDDPEMVEAVARVLRACKAARKISLIFAGDARRARALAEMGYDGVAYSIDALIYIDAYKAIVKRFKEESEEI
jgi:4-hydroxy-2-oxoheptanedioate aldolase